MAVSLGVMSLARVAQLFLPDMIYCAVGLSRSSGPFFKPGALLIGSVSVFTVDDHSHELKEIVQTELMQETQPDGTSD